VPDPLNAQAWNRYSYVGNDPLTFTDPTGFSWLSSFFHQVAHFLSSHPLVRAVFQIAITVILTAALGPAGAGLSLEATAVIAAAAGAAIVTGLSGGRIGDIIRASAIAGATALAFYGVGQITQPAAGATIAEQQFDSVANIAGHAGVGCLSALASGGACGPGALSAGAGSAVSPVALQAGLFGGTAISGIAGGLASLAVGGKFADGAVTAAFGYLFNSIWHSYTAVPFIDDQGNTVWDYYDKQMMRPYDVDPHFFVDAATSGTTFGGLFNFLQSGDWDVQRVGTDRIPTKVFEDFSTVAIGLYGAARGIPADAILSMEDSYAATHSYFGSVVMDSTYVHLPVTNVWNTRLGYDLFNSGRIGSSPSQ